MNQAPTPVDENAILREQEARRAARTDLERLAVLRVYNYFRIIVSFVLFILFYEVDDQTMVGTLEPRWFQFIGAAYLALNLAAGLGVLLDPENRSAHPNIIGSIVVLDIFFLTLLLLTSGGVDSGLGYLLVFSVAFGSVMIGGRQSLSFPAIASVNALSVELYMGRTGAVIGDQHFYEVAVLGVVLFIVNFFFQYVARLVADREREVVSLETLDRMHRIAEQSRLQLEIAHARFNALLKSTGEGVLVLDRSGAIIFANQASAELLGCDPADRNIRDFLLPPEPGEDMSRHAAEFMKMIGSDAAEFSTCRWQTGNLDPFLVSFSFEISEAPPPLESDIVLLFRNVTRERENEDRLQYLANHDELTGLSNRNTFKEILASAIQRMDRFHRGLAVLIVDSDHFTVVNEERGEAVGDEMLKVMAARLTALVREGDFVARLHGDQFAIMLTDLDNSEDAAIVAEKINFAMTQPIEVGGETLDNSVSIGIAVLGEDTREVDELLSAATSAVAMAKSDGRNTYRFHQPDMQKKADDKKRVQVMLRTAVENDEFRLMFQPIISIAENRIYSSEALIRWFPGGGDPIRPDIFIPIAEESGQIQAIGSWVLEEVSRQLERWHELLGHYPAIAINVSSRQLRDEAFRLQFQNIVSTRELPVHVVEMELTETGVMEDPETSLAELNRLRDLGVKISIDDFGTGYSSLDYLRRLPLDLLKIDQSFTRGIGVSPNDEEIVRVMIRMAHAMGLRVICEGVETREHLDFLRHHDCDFVQGYYFSKPRTAEGLTELLLGEKRQSIDLMAGEAAL